MMTESPPTDDPPTYSAVTLSDTTPIVKDDEKKFIVPVVADDSPFEEKNSRNIFALKVLSIFLLQVLVEGFIIGSAFAFGISFWHRHNSDARIGLLVTSSLLYFATLAAMVYCDLRVKERTIYNYFILVISPLIVCFAVIALPALCGSPNYGPIESLMSMIFIVWMCYLIATIGILIFSVFTLNSEKSFNLVACISTGTSVFTIVYLVLLPVMIGSDVQPLSAFFFALFLCTHFVYVLYDIHKMTGREYRTSMTPDDYVKGAVNLQIDFLFMFKDFYLKNLRKYFVNE